MKLNYLLNNNYIPFDILNNYSCLALLMFFNTLIGMPPSEFICILFGLYAATEGLNIIYVIIIGTIFNTIGTTILYFIAYHYGKNTVDNVIYYLTQKNLHYILYVIGMSNNTLNYIEIQYKKRGYFIIFSGRNIPLLRSVISLPAGYYKMPFKIFIMYTTLGILLWVTAWTLLGYYAANLSNSYISIFFFIVPFSISILFGKYLFRK